MSDTSNPPAAEPTAASRGRRGLPWTLYVLHLLAPSLLLLDLLHATRSSMAEKTDLLLGALCGLWLLLGVGVWLVLHGVVVQLAK